MGVKLSCFLRVVVTVTRAPRGAQVPSGKQWLVLCFNYPDSRLSQWHQQYIVFVLWGQDYRVGFRWGLGWSWGPDWSWRPKAGQEAAS